MILRIVSAFGCHKSKVASKLPSFVQVQSRCSSPFFSSLPSSLFHSHRPVFQLQFLCPFQFPFPWWSQSLFQLPPQLLLPRHPRPRRRPRHQPSLHQRDLSLQFQANHRDDTWHTCNKHFVGLVCFHLFHLMKGGENEASCSCECHDERSASAWQSSEIYM